MLNGFGNIFFFQHITAPFSHWFLNLGLKAAGWATAAVANTWLREELFSDLKAIDVPTLILHGIHDRVVPFQLGEVQGQSIMNSRLIPFEYSGHGLFYDEKDKFNEELTKFVEE
ncbi:Arylesterase [Clostridium luticellarii]|uniref:Arylesterase n=1 Tax=Clostridium luticellarii TaxID=1691940 RepID=A0A2T0BEG5_9CLOT|nr:Arylesterase [Clostridium luticellarii]